MNQRTRIKICGLTRAEDVQAAVEAGADALGFVFYPPSPRFISSEDAAELIRTVPPFVTTVGLFVNSTRDEVLRTTETSGISLLQFHGDETAADCATIAEHVNLPFIRAFRVRAETQAEDLIQYKLQYQSASDRFQALLLDSHSEAYGGTGKVFNWSLISKEIAHQVVLSGGLNAQNAAGAVRQIRPYAVDVSSGVESSRGIKDAGKIHEFIKAVRQTDPVF